MDAENQPNGQEPRKGSKGKELTDEQRTTLFNMCLVLTKKNGEIRHGAFSKVAAKFKDTLVDRSTVSRLWAKRTVRMVSNLIIIELPPKMTHNRGRKPIYCKEEFQQALKNMPLSNRRNLRDIAHGMNIGLTTVHNYLKSEDMWRCSSALKPSLTEQNKMSRVLFVMEHIVNKVLPAIAAKCPIEMKAKPILIQQDNAPCHMKGHDPDFQTMTDDLNLVVKMYEQPPNSPDTNINDLGFFASLQSLQHKKAPMNTKQLIEAVEDCFETYESYKLNRVFLTLMSCFNEILRVQGSNSYKLPHMGKESLERNDLLPNTISAEDYEQYLK